MDIFYRSLFPRRGSSRRARKLLIIAALAVIPALGAGVSQALGTPSIVTASTQDDGDGFIDKVRITFSTTMDTTLTPRVSMGTGSPGFRVAGYQIDTSKGTAGFTWSGSQTLDIHLVQASAPDTGATPNLVYVPGDGGVSSAAPAPAEMGAVDRTVADGAGPVLISVRGKDVAPFRMFKGAGDELLVTFSEPTKLAGATKADRWSNLERAIRFENVPSEGGYCPVDGDGAIQNYNFPQPKADKPSGVDPIVAPANASTPATTFTIRLANTADQWESSRDFAAVPTGCWVGIDAGTNGVALNRATLSDGANNVASPMTVPAGAPQKVRINPVDAEIVSATSRDTDANGVLDAVDLTFNNLIAADTIEQTYQVTSGAASATVTGVEVGQVATQVRVRFTAPASWGTGTLPTVAYTKPASCSASGGSGLKAALYGGLWRTCVASFSLPALDGAGPVLVTSSTRDVDGNGYVDTVALTFNEAIADTANKSTGWTVDGQTGTLTLDPDDARLATLTVTSPNIDSGSRPTLAYVPQNSAQGQGSMDGAGNQAAAFSGLVQLDGAAPRIVDAAEYDTNGDGNVDRAVLTYSEPLVDPANAAGFTVGGRSAALLAPAGSDEANDQILTVSVSGLSGTDTKEIVYAPGAAVRDAAGNVTGAQTVIAADVADEAAPRATVTVSPSAPIPAGESTIVVTFTEPMDDAVAPTVTFTTEQGAKTVTPTGFSADARSWQGTIQVVEADCSVPTGCPVTASASGGQDPAGHALAATASLTTEIDTLAPTAPVIGSFTATLPAGETAPANTLNMFATGFALGASIVPGEASPGVATVLLDGTPLAGATDATIAPGDDSISAGRSFTDAAALHAAIAEGGHTLTVELCDDAGNCSTTATGLDILADYTPALDVTLTSPTGEQVVAGGSTVDIVWDGADGDGFDSVSLAYSTNGGQSYPHAIASGLTDRDGTYAWTVPSIDSRDVVVRASLSDAQGNRSVDASAPFVIRTNPVFGDVAASYWARPYIEALYDARITEGCGNGRYCPRNSVTRGQMAVFLVRALGEDQDLGPYQGTFSDVPASMGGALFIERLAELGITGGCGEGRFCPKSPVTRGQMAVFLVRALGEDANLGDYQGLFTDVPSTHSFALFIEKLADLDITGGCGGGRYCPGNSVTRAQMAVFMQKAWDLPMLG